MGTRQQHEKFWVENKLPSQVKKLVQFKDIKWWIQVLFIDIGGSNNSLWRSVCLDGLWLYRDFSLIRYWQSIFYIWWHLGTLLGIYHLLQVSQHSERMFAYRHISYFMTVVLQLSFVSVHDLLGGKSRFCSDLASSHLNWIFIWTQLSNTYDPRLQDSQVGGFDGRHRLLHVTWRVRYPWSHDVEHYEKR